METPGEVIPDINTVIDALQSELESGQLSFGAIQQLLIEYAHTYEQPIVEAVINELQTRRALGGIALEAFIDRRVELTRS